MHLIIKPVERDHVWATYYGYLRSGSEEWTCAVTQDWLNYIPSGERKSSYCTWVESMWDELQTSWGSFPLTYEEIWEALFQYVPPETE